MDRTGIIVVAICAILLGFWFHEQQKYYPHRPPPPVSTNAPAAAPVTPMSSNAALSASHGISTSAPLFDTNAPEQLLVITNTHVRYTFTSRGGGLKLVELLNYPETISPRWQKTAPTNGVATLNTRAPLPVLAITGDARLTGDGNFTLTRTTGGVRAEKSLPDGLKLVKEFSLSSNYLVNASVRLENDSNKPLDLPAQDWIVGTATPMDVDDNGFYVYGGALWFNGTSSQPVRLSYFNPSTTFLLFFPRTPKTEYVAGSSNVVWAAADNQFFALLAMPRQPAEQVVALPVTLPPFPDVDLSPDAPPPQGVQTALVYPSVTLAPHQTIERQIALFAGPKEYRLLARIGDTYNNQADLVMQFGKFTGFFTKALLLAMNWLHDVTKFGYGLVIVLITVIIKLVFWPLTAASTRSMKRMQALQPEIKALKEKYKDDQQKVMQKQMELWKKHKINPMSGCLPMAIQMPVFIGFFMMIRSAIELRGAHFLWIADLSKPDTLFMIPGTHFPFNLLPLLMGGAMLWQSHLTPPSPGMDPSQQKIMRYMPLMFLVFLYNYSSGLTLYWTVNNVLTIVQTKLTRMNQPVTATVTAPATASALTPAAKKKK